MKSKYSISYFIIITSIILAFILAFSFENKYQVDRYAKIAEDEDVIINSNSERVISEGYYLKELDGYVIVYLYDQKTIFELTDIRIDDLELNLQEEIKAGKYIETTKELYGFLETYTS